MLVTLVLAGYGSALGQTRNLCAVASPYDYDKNLRDGYRLAVRNDGESKYLDLYRGRKKVRELSSVSCGLSDKNLGYIGADFRDSFVLAQSFGSGNPHWVQLIQKSSGKNLLGKSREACWIDADEKYSVFLFSYDCVPDQADRIVLLNVSTGKKRSFYFPKFMFSKPELLGRIEIASITRSSLVLRFSDSDRKVTQTRRYRY